MTTNRNQDYMTVDDMIEIMEEMRHTFGGDTPIRFASQPAWPFEYTIDEEVAVTEDDEGNACVYLVEGTQIGYLPSEVQQDLGWGMNAKEA